MSFDLDAAVAEAEAKTPSERFEFTFGGEAYTLAPRIDLRVGALLSKGQLFEALELLLGAEQWERMQASPAVFDDQALKLLLESYAASTGSSVGESSASPRRSQNTAKRSRPTSKGTTKLR